MNLSVKQFGSSGAQNGDVVMIHGTGARAEMWLPQVGLLERLGYRCIVPDLRGHGESAEPGGVSDLAAHLADVLETLSGLDVRYPAVFAGHSLGSIISLELAERQPELVRKILAVSMPGKVPLPTVATFRIMLGWPYHALRKTGVYKGFGWRERVLFETNHYSLWQIAENFASLNYVDRIPRVDCPVHFAVGRFDPVAPAHLVEHMHRRLPGSTFQLIEWAGHNPMDSQPEAFNRWFLRRMSI